MNTISERTVKVHTSCRSLNMSVDISLSGQEQGSEEGEKTLATVESGKAYRVTRSSRAGLQFPVGRSALIRDATLLSL